MSVPLSLKFNMKMFPSIFPDSQLGLGTSWRKFMHMLPVQENLQSDPCLIHVQTLGVHKKERVVNTRGSRDELQ